MNRIGHTARHNRRDAEDRCEVCGTVLARRPHAHRRRCADHLAQLALVPLRAVARPTRSAA